jgi:putative ABC transport system ATP-binding protein
MLKLSSLRKAYRTESVETTALDNIDLQIDAGEFVAIMGPSGCGKSTLLNIIGLLDRPTAGNYSLEGREVARLTENELTDIRKRRIGFIFQNFNLIDELSVRENVELALLYHGISASERKSRVDAVLDKVGIGAPRRPPPEPVVGWPAAARRRRARGGRGAADDPRRRTDRQPRHRARRGSHADAARASTTTARQSSWSRTRRHTPTMPAAPSTCSTAACSSKPAAPRDLLTRTVPARSPAQPPDTITLVGGWAGERAGTVLPQRSEGTKKC